MPLLNPVMYNMYEDFIMNGDLLNDIFIESSYNCMIKNLKCYKSKDLSSINLIQMTYDGS